MHDPCTCKKSMSKVGFKTLQCGSAPRYSVDLRIQTYTEQFPLKSGKTRPKMSADMRIFLQCSVDGMNCVVVAGPDVTWARDSESGVDVVISDRLGDSAPSQVIQTSLLILILSSSSSSSRWWWKCEGETGACCGRSATCHLPQSQRIH